MIDKRPQLSYSVQAEGYPWRRRPVAYVKLILAAFASTIGPFLLSGCATQPQPEAVWPNSTLDEANGARTKLLANPRFDAQALPPIHQGYCGIPAPIQLYGFRASPPVIFSPPATIARPTAEALEYWVATTVQPAAWRILGAPVSRVVLMGSYTCRTRNSNPFERLSAHAFGAAVDVAGFVTVRGDRIMIKDNWRRPGPGSAFLHQAHHGACGAFGVVLGPNTNAMHYNHFHLEVTRQKTLYCR
jgi:hypothetical protein